MLQDYQGVSRRGAKDRDSRDEGGQEGRKELETGHCDFFCIWIVSRNLLAGSLGTDFDELNVDLFVG